MDSNQPSSPTGRALDLHDGPDLLDADPVWERSTTSRSDPSNRNAAGIARSQMTPQEAEYWDHYLAGHIKLPTIDWDHDRAQPTTGKKGKQTEKRRAEALNRLYNVDCAETSHAAWILSNHSEFLPLLKAMARVIGAERQYGTHSSDVDVLTPLLQIQKLNKAISATTQLRKGYGPGFKLQKRELDVKITSLINERWEIRRRRLADRSVTG